MPATATYSPTGNPYVDGDLSGIKWAVPNLTFSFPSDSTFYEYSGEPSVGFKPFSAAQQTATRSILKMDASVANLTFTEITETSTQHADLRLAGSNAPSTAWAYYPSTGPAGGDAWFNVSNHYYDNPVKGNYAYLAITHELGHTLGLKHPHEARGAFGAMPADHDSLEYSVMSYHSYVGGPIGYSVKSGGYPQTLMMYDIAGLQAAYGANYSTNSGDTIYGWDPNTGQTFIDGVGQGAPSANRIFLTVWDGGGKDTYDFSNYSTNLNVNLVPGSWTTASTAQLANLGSGHMAAGNIANALLYQNNLASLVENVIGGSGKDTIIGNVADNEFTGGAGNDILDGAAGINTALYSGNVSDYSVVQNAAGGWTVTDLRAGSPDGTDTVKNIQYLKFSNSTIALGTSAPQNGAPVAADDSFSIGMNTQLKLGSPGVLANDTDPDGNALTAALVSTPSHGSVSLGADGSLIYTPNANFVGVDSFTYKASDGAAGSIATATINVHNATPVAADDSFKTSMNTKLVLGGPGVLANDTDPDGNALTAALVSTPSHGSVSLGADGSLIYTPNANFVGVDSFTYKASDGAAGSIATATINVHNATPVAADDSFKTSMNTKLVLGGPGVLANDTDPDGNALTAALVSTPSHGSVSLGADGSLIYTPNANFVGADSFTYKASDGAADSIATATINVHNATPVAADDYYATAKGVKLAVKGSGILANDTGATGDPLSAMLVSKPSHGTIALKSDGTFDYTPSKKFVGIDYFTYKVSDGTASDTASVWINVGGNASPPAQNAVPEAKGESYDTGFNAKLSVGGSGVLANDTDADGNLLSSVLVSKPSHGSVTLNANGTFVYTPAKNFTGQDSFSYKVSDGWSLSDVAIATIQVAQNAVPEAKGESYATATNTKLSAGGSGVLANDTDADGNPLSAVLVSKPSHGSVNLNANGTFAYTPSKKFVGQDSFSYKVSDGASLSDVATATIQVGSQAVVAGSGHVLASIKDISNDQILPPHPSNALPHSSVWTENSNNGRIEKFQALFDSNKHASQDWASVHNGGDTHAPAVEDHNLPGTHDAHLLLQ